MKRTCESCDYWCCYSNGGIGECRRHAPAPMYSMSGDKPGPIWWPQTLSAFWCGDFAYRVAERPAGHEVADAAYNAAWNRLVANSRKSPEKSPRNFSEKNPKKNTKREHKVDESGTK